MKQSLHRMGASTKRVTHAVGALAMLGAGHVYAALPAASPPTTAPSSSSNWLDFIKFYAKDAFLALALIVMAWGLIQVVGKVLSMYGDLSSGRITWGDIGGAAVGGATLLLFGVVLTTAAIAII
ncbi:MAG: TIGR03745 family integrating conjugative element membrane protein [Gammaproteobacteria bacterium]|nr:TIGR03745 family integrating conjugative element membrane protein [Gammaproteobacteria bacterium]